MRAYLFTALAATLAGLMNVAQDKGITSQYGQGAELIVIAAVIVGGASIAGGRGRVLGACMGAALVVLIDKVLREGIPIVRTIEVGGIKMDVQAMAQLPGGAVQAFLGIILLGAVLVEPWAIKGGGAARAWARLRGHEAPPAPDRGEAAIVGAQTKGAKSEAKGMGAKGFRAFLARRDAAAIILVVILWCVGMLLRPDFWGSLDNSFNLLLAFTEIAMVPVGLTFVIANGDIDLSVGSVLALSGAAAAFLMKEHGRRSVAGRRHRGSRRHAARLRQRHPDRALRPARLRRHAGHVLHRPRPRLLAGRRAAALRLPGKLQSHRP